MSINSVKRPQPRLRAKSGFEQLILLSIQQPWLILLTVLGMAALGLYHYQKLPIDAVPDITNLQVQINTEADGYSPLEAEQRLTFPIETAMAGLPKLQQTRSLSRYGLSQVTVVFEDGTDIYFARQLVSERIQQVQAELPSGLIPRLGPITTGLGEIYMWTLETTQDARKADGSRYSLTDLREIQDWVIKPQLRTVPGVTEINSLGGYSKEYLVAPDPAKLQAYDLQLSDLQQTLLANNANLGAGYIERLGEQYLVRAPGQLSSLDEIGELVVQVKAGVPIRIRDLAQVSLGQELRTGAATENGREVVLGTVFMLLGENSRRVALAVDQKLKAINQSLPAGVYAQPVYDRTLLVDKAIATVKTNLLEGALLVIAVLFLFLGNLRAALITAAVIPLSMLFTFSGMAMNKISANLMSLGALDFGIIVDGAVVIVENCVRRLSHAQQQAGKPLSRQQRFAEVFEAAREARRPLLFGQLIIMLVYLPIFALTGVEGKMFHPMAATVVIALLGALLLSISFVPAAIALLLTKPIQERENWLMRWAQTGYQPVLHWSLRHSGLVLSLAASLLLLSLALVTRLGTEFVPSLNEGDIALHAMRVPGTSLSQSIAMQQQLEQQLLRQPEVERVFAKLGTAEIATDPMPPSVADTFVMLKPRDQWPDPALSHLSLLQSLQQRAAQVPGSNYEFTQPIQMRFNELISGVRSDVAIKVFGDELPVMESTAQAIAQVLARIPGAADVKVEPTTGLPSLSIELDRAKLSRLGLEMAVVQNTLTTAIGGVEAGVLFEGDRKFDIKLRLAEDQRQDLALLQQLPIRLPGEAAQYLSLGELAKFDLKPGPNQISRENGKRRVVVTANVRGRDIGSFVADASAQIQAQVKVPSGYWTLWGGTFEQMQSAQARLQLLIPVTLLLVLTLLFMLFNQLKDGVLVFTGVPFALTGGILALWLRDIPLSMSAAVGFIALSGVAVLNGLVMLSFIRNLRQQGMSLEQAVRNGALSRLRPVLMTALVASLGFIPMAIATGTGAEVQRPLATVVIGGVLSSTLLTLLVLPVLYRLCHRQSHRQ